MRPVFTPMSIWTTPAMNARTFVERRRMKTRMARQREERMMMSDMLSHAAHQFLEQMQPDPEEEPEQEPAMIN